MQLSLKDIFNIIPGKWKLTRNIKDIAYAEGCAYFTLKYKDTINYFEEVEVKYFAFNSSNIISKTKARRNYIFEFNLTNNIIYQYFADNQLYTKLKPEMAKDKTLKYSGKHLCSNDEYYNIYEFVDQNNFKVLNQVKGPHKDYSIETLYKKYK